MPVFRPAILNAVRVVLIYAVAAAGVLASRAIARADEEQWYKVELSGQHAGWMRATERVMPDRVATASQLRIEVRRGQVELTIGLDTEFVETPEGRPLSMRLVRRFGNVPMSQEYVFEEDGVRVTSAQGGDVTTTVDPPPEGEWLTPRRAALEAMRRIKAGEAEFTLRTIDPSSGPVPMEVTYRGVRAERVERLGATVDGYRADVEMALMPGVVTSQWMDADGNVVRMETLMGGLAMGMVLSDRESATARSTAPELMIGTFVKPDRAIRAPRKITSAQYVLSLPDGTMPDLVSDGAQTAERIDAQSVRVRVHPGRPAPARPAGSDTDYAGSSMLVAAGDAEVVALARRATEGVGPDPVERARAMAGFVHGHVKGKGLGVGFASASEVARSREGDCSEHGVLLAAMLRAEGIPSRVVCGVLYVDEFAGQRDIFGYHLWTQALVEVDGEQRWIDLDATMPPGAPFDATHIAFVTSDLSDARGMAPLAEVAPLMGRLKIVVERAE